MKLISQESWSYSFYQDDERYFLSVLCGSVAMYGIAIELTEDEIVRVNEGGLSGLVGAVRMSPNSYKHRHINDFNHSVD
jgi:hypothetical protein